MKHIPGRFRFSGEAPLAIVVATTSWDTKDEAICEETLTGIRSALASLTDSSFPNYSQQQHQNVSFLSPNFVPQIQSQTVHLYLSEDRKSGVSLSNDTLSLFVGSYTEFAKFELLFRKIIESLDDLGIRGKAKTLGLRFVNLLDVDNQEFDDLTLTGLKRGELTRKYTHFHHKYEFWCQTKLGRFFFRVSTEHGDRVPENLGLADKVFPMERLRSYDNYVYHMDIFENATFPEEITNSSVFKVFKEMHLRIDDAFLNGVNEEYLQTLGIEEK